MPAMKAVVGVAAVLAFIILAFVTISAQGAPATPTASISATPNPAVATTYQITLTTQFYSLVAPNTIYQIGANFIYSVWQSGSNGGGRVQLAANQTVPFHTLSSSGNIYTVTGVFSVSAAAICSGTGCASQPYNITVQVKATVSTYVAFWQSAVTTIVFSNFASYQVIPAQGAVNASGFYLELFVPVTAIAAVACLTGYAIAAKHPVFLYGAGVAAVLILVEVLIW